MFKRSILLLTTLFLLAGLAYPHKDTKKMQKVKDNESAVQFPSAGNYPQLKKLNAGSQLFFTDYDYAGNNSIPSMLEMFDFDGDGKLDVVGTGMQRADAGSRNVLLILGSGTDFTTVKMNQSLSHGWGTLQIAKEGPLAGNAMIMTHGGGNSWLYKTDMSTFNTVFPADAFATGNFPSFVYKPDGTVYYTNTVGFLNKYTNDFANVDSLGWLDPDLAVSGYPSEYILKMSPDGQTIAHFAAWGYAGNGPIDGASEDSTDFVGLNLSTDGGSTWTFEMIGKDGVTPVANRPDVFPIFENFGQINGLVDANHVVHITMNGYGFKLLNDTTATFAFPAVYWNSRDKQWIALTSENMEDVDNDTTFNYPGNGLGNAYPIVSASADGQTLVVAWQGPEFVNEVGSAYSLFTPTAESPNVIRYTDLYYVVSADGGKTWGAPQILEGEKQV